MFVSFLYPFDFRNDPAQLLWIFYKQLSRFAPDECCYIGSPEYFLDPEIWRERGRWEAFAENAQRVGYAVPAKDDMENVGKYVIEPSIFHNLIGESVSNLVAWKFLMTRPYKPLVAALLEIFTRILKRTDIEAVLTWCNCPSLTLACERYAIKIIHNELGPLREPVYRPTAYFDFSGVNANTECARRLAAFRSCEESARLASFSREELIWLSAKPQYGRALLNDVAPKYAVGVALQVENDSNLIAYSNGYAPIDLIAVARQSASDDAILIRRHPSGWFNPAFPSVTIDDSTHSFEFIQRCARTLTINSSVFMESLLLGRPAYALGQNPFALASGVIQGGKMEDGESVALTTLNYFMLGYLIPSELLFHVGYYRFRLSAPSEAEIFKAHLAFYAELYSVGEKASAQDVKTFFVPADGAFLERTVKRLLHAQRERECERAARMGLLHERATLVEERNILQSQLREKDLECLVSVAALQESSEARTEAERSLHAIHHSKAWKMLGAYYRTRDFIRNRFFRLRKRNGGFEREAAS